ncbi:MAG: tyrosine-type recombinase/integrase [Sphingomonas phyllosphaerae]|uniref:tyrosine-type recombinase/integrase n=1 Tax=Sphingomonas phyllosphaerae TaxID=257003 RepID=UPI002FFCC706
MIAAVEGYLELRKQLGYQDADLRVRLRKFAAFAAARGASHLRNHDVLAWTESLGSANSRRTHLDWLANLGVFLRAEDDRHEILPPDYKSRLGRRNRLTPFVYCEEEILRIMDGFGSLGLRHPYDASTYRAIIGLIAATGMRLSEALNLRLADMNGAELFVRQSKFKKDRLVFVDDSTVRALSDYLALRPPKLDAPQTVRDLDEPHTQHSPDGPGIPSMHKPPRYEGPGWERAAPHPRSAAYLRHQLARRVRAR